MKKGNAAGGSHMRRRLPKLKAWSGKLEVENKKIRRKQVDKQVFNVAEFDSLFENALDGLGKEALTELMHKFEEEMTQESVDLSAQNLRGRPARLLGMVLAIPEVSAVCKKLDLSSNFMRDEDLVSFLTPFASTNEAGKRRVSETALTRKTNVSLNTNSSESTAMKTLRKRLITGKRSHLQVEELDLSNNRLGVKCGTEIARVVSGNSYLKNLNLETNNITASGCESICHALEKNESLEELSLSWNNLNVFAEDFFFTLSRNQSLKILKLGYCNLGDTVARALGDGLTENNTLTELYVYGNNITDKGGNHLFQCLYENDSLLYLNLANNMLTDSCGQKFIDLMVDRRRVRIDGSFSPGKDLFVNLLNNELSDEMSKELQSLRVQRNRQLTKIVAENYGRYNEIPIDDEEDTIHMEYHIQTQDLNNYVNNKFYELSIDDPDEYSYEGSASMSYADSRAASRRQMEFASTYDTDEESVINM
eukprot:augustus_masked-scaffold_4-processed-gene-8.51-mRNA-1 protein AED:0.44 eAED:0.44 QI:0/-1/0/1/-1/1/1/0/478